MYVSMVPKLNFLNIDSGTKQFLQNIPLPKLDGAGRNLKEYICIENLLYNAPTNS
jgi:hypothetical protein